MREETVLRFARYFVTVATVLFGLGGLWYLICAVKG
jgi:hypothetical protein